MKQEDKIFNLGNKLETLDRMLSSVELQVSKVNLNNIKTEQKLDAILKHLENEHDLVLEEIPVKQAHYVLKEKD